MYIYGATSNKIYLFSQGDKMQQEFRQRNKFSTSGFGVRLAVSKISKSKIIRI